MDERDVLDSREDRVLAVNLAKPLVRVRGAVAQYRFHGCSPSRRRGPRVSVRGGVPRDCAGWRRRAIVGRSSRRHAPDTRGFEIGPGHGCRATVDPIATTPDRPAGQSAVRVGREDIVASPD